MPTLETILKKIRQELKEKDKTRDSAQEDMRKATSLSKQTILLVHQKEYDEARKLLQKAKKIITRLNITAETHPEIIYGGLFSSARQEYSEANLFLNLVRKSEFTNPEEIGVPPVDYVLGLADVIGELRRLVLDLLREGFVERGEEILRVMDEIYIELMSLDEVYMLVPGLRRRCDVARKIIQITRGDVTQEVRRNSLEKQLKSLEQIVKKTMKHEKRNRKNEN